MVPPDEIPDCIFIYKVSEMVYHAGPPSTLQAPLHLLETRTPTLCSTSSAETSPPLEYKLNTVLPDFP